jgi:hypothetical protein
MLPIHREIGRCEQCGDMHRLDLGCPVADDWVAQAIVWCFVVAVATVFLWLVFGGLR